MYICICNAVTDRDIRNAAGSGVRSMSELRLATGCGTRCGSCAGEAMNLLKQAVSEADCESIDHSVLRIVAAQPAA